MYLFLKQRKNGKIYSKIEGKGKASYYYLDAITAVLSGFIYAVNPYLPMALAIIVSGFACMLSLMFDEIEEEKKEEKIVVKEYLKDLKSSFSFILHSKRLKSLLIYSVITWGFMCLMSEYRTTLLTDIGTSSQIMGIMTAIFGIVSGIASKKQVKFHNIFRNHSLAVIAISCAFSMIIPAVVVLIGAQFWVCVIIILIFGIIGKADNAMNNILINRYLGNFSSQDMVSKIYASNSLVKNLLRMTIGMLGSWLVGVMPSPNATLYAGIVFLIASIFIILYMKPRVGLKPEEYSKEEVEMKV